MRKKKLMLLFIFLCFGIFIPNAIAEEECITQVSMPTLGDGRVINFGGRRANRPVFFFNVGGVIAFCQNSGGHMNDGANLIQSGCGVTPEAKLALNYCEGKCTRAGDGGAKYLIAQAYVWGFLETEAAEGYCDYLGVSDCGVAHLAYVRNVYNDIANSGSGGSFACWEKYPKDILYQTLASKVVDACKQVCPDNTDKPGVSLDSCLTEDNKTLDACIAEVCYSGSCPGVEIRKNDVDLECVNNNISKDIVFSESPADGSEVMGLSSSSKGYLEAKVSKYGALYCYEEAATIHAPGGYANPIRRGSSLVWPTSTSDFCTIQCKENDESDECKKCQTLNPMSVYGNMFPLIFEGKRKCGFHIMNLTYENKCGEGHDPILDFENAFKAVIGARDGKQAIAQDGTEHGSAAVEKPEWFTTSGRTNEEIRYDKNNKWSSSCKNRTIWTEEEQCASKYFGDQYGWANENYKQWEITKKQAVDACDAKADVAATCTNTGCSCSSGELKNTTCEYTQSWCESNDPDAIDAQEQMDFWTTTMGDISKAREAFKEYAENYRYMVEEVYLGIWKIAYYTGLVSCGGEACPVYYFQTGANVRYTDEDDGDYVYYAGNDGQVITLMRSNSVTYTCDRSGKGCGPGAFNNTFVYPDSETGNAEEAWDDLYSLRLVDEGPEISGGLYAQIAAKGENPIDTKNHPKTDKQPLNYAYKFAQIINELEQAEIYITTNKIEYRLPDGKYNYYDKDKDKFVDYVPGDDGNYIRVGYSNLPTSLNNIPGKKYDIGLTNLIVGHMGQFGGDSSNYKCNYTVGDNSECQCPPGTRNAGMDLYGALLQNDGLTCADAKLKYCDYDNPPKCNVDCEEAKYCKDDDNGKIIKINSCVNAGMSVADCSSLLCKKDRYYCDDGGYGNAMDISSCVHTRMAQGSTEAQAKSYCEKVLCNGKEFIYRTIDLKNPFPSKDADDTVSQLTKMRAYMTKQTSISRTYPFNTNTWGRFPGINWNGANVVTKKIINLETPDGDKVNDYDIYNQTPLYHFELDTATILRIREFNDDIDRNGYYNDFKLDCISTYESPLLGTACYSNFVHGPEYGGDTTGSKSLCGGSTRGSLATCLYGRGE